MNPKNCPFSKQFRARLESGKIFGKIKPLLSQLFPRFDQILTSLARHSAAYHTFTQLETRTQIPAVSSPYTGMCEARWRSRLTCSYVILDPCDPSSIPEWSGVFSKNEQRSLDFMKF